MQYVLCIMPRYAALKTFRGKKGIDPLKNPPNAPVYVLPVKKNNLPRLQNQ